MTAIGEAFVTLRPDASQFADETQGFFKANAGKFALAGAGIGVAIAGGFAALKLGESFDAAFDTIRLGTGATGEALKGLQADFKGVFQSVPTDAGLAASAVAVVQVSASGAASSNSPFAKRVGINSAWYPSRSAVSTTVRRYANVGGRSARFVPMCAPSPSIGMNQSKRGSGRTPGVGWVITRLPVRA